MTNKTKANRAQRRMQERQARRAGAAGHAPSLSRPAARAQSSSRPSRADKLDLVDRFDPFINLRNGLRKVAKAQDQWAGIPMPLDGERLIVEPKYPHATELMSLGRKDAPESPEFAGAKEVNSWYCNRRRCDIIVFRYADGRTDWGVKPAFHSLNMAMITLGCSDAWGIEQESNALQLLATLITHHQFKQYLLTGMFVESSKRSKVFYMFRKLRPIVAIVPSGEGTKVLTTLCMHPIAYYGGSWAGAMCPTDDVVAHLMMMRGDEHMFWKRSNQHPAHRPEAGL